MIYKPYFPVIGARRDILGTATPTQISGEQHHVVDGYIKLHEVPQYLASGQNVVVPGYTEVTAAPTGYQFRVNYTTGRVYFATAQEGALVKVTYKGLGSLTAVDEINWLWEQLTERNTFANLSDGPGTYEGYAYSFLRVNKTETGLEFVPPTTGKSNAKFILLDIAAGASVQYEAGQNDIVSTYEVITRNDASIVAPGTWTLDGIAITETDDGDFYTLAAPAAGVTRMMRADNMAELVDWNVVTGLAIGGSVPANAAMHIMLTIDSVPQRLFGNTLVPVTVAAPADVVTYGLTPEDIAALPSMCFDALVGKSVGLIVAMTSTDGVATPQFDGYLRLQGAAGGGYAQVSYLDVKLNTQTGMWTFTSTAAATKRVLIVVGSGRDDICCSSDFLVFEDVPAGATVAVKAPKQTTVQVYKKLDTTESASLVITAPAAWVSVDGVLSESLTSPSGTLMQYIDAAKNLNTAYGSLFSLLTFDNGTISDKFGNYGFVNSGAKTLVPGFTGPAMYMTDFSHIRVSDSWLYNGSDFGSGAKYPGRTIGGLFKWVSGYPAIISPYCGQSYESIRGGWYQNCAAYLGSNYVGFNCGRTWKYLSYPAGSWVFVAIYALWSRWIGGVYDDKQFTGYCNAATVQVYHKESSVVEGLDRLTAVPGAIGNGASQISSPGAFMVDTAFVSRVADPGAADFNSMRALQADQRAAAYSNRQFYVYKLASPFSKDNWPQIKRLTVAQKLSVCSNTARFLFESDGTLYAYDATNAVFVSVSKEQPLSTLWDLATPEGSIASIPDWKLNSIASTSMNIWAITTMSAVSSFTPTDGRGGEVARIYTGATLYTGDILQAWKMLKPDDFSLTWCDESETWTLKNNTDSTLTLRAVVAGQTAQDVLAATLFTDLEDTPDNLNWSGKRILVAGDGRVTTSPYINPLMMGMP